MICLLYVISTRFNNELSYFCLLVFSVKKAIELKSRGVKMLPSKDSNHKNSVCKLFIPLSLVTAYNFWSPIKYTNQREGCWETMVIKWLLCFQFSLNKNSAGNTEGVESRIWCCNV